jgi:zinc protease
MRILIALFALLFCAQVAVADKFDLIELKTPNGVKFNFLRSDVQSIVAVALAFKGGVASDGMEGPAVGILAPALMTTGAGGKSTSELYEAMQDFGGNFSLSSTTDQTYAILSAPQKGIMGAAALANLVLTKPDFPERKLQQRRDAYAQRLEEYAAYPDSKVQLAFANAVSEPHPYQNYNNPNAKSVRLVTRADMAPWMAKHITKDGILVSVVGDLEPAQASVLVDQILNGVPDKSDVAPTPKMIFKAPPQQPIEVRVETGDQAIVIMGTAFPFNGDLKEWIGASLLSSIFSGDQKTRLFKDIREGSGATYGLQPIFSFAEALTTNAITGRISKTNSDKTLALIKASWDKFRISGPTDAEIGNAKANMLHYFGDLGRNHAALASFLRDYMTGHWTTAEIASLPDVVEQSNLTDPKLLAKLFPETPLIVIAQ